MQDIQLIGNKDHRITTTLPDLLAACEKAVLVDKVPIRKLRKRIKFFNAERLELGKTPAFGEELFTRKIIQRRPYKIGSDILEIMIKILKKEKLNWNQKLEIVQTKIKQLFTELISNRIMGENAQTVITKAVKSVLHNLSSKTKLENESIIVKNVNVKKFLDSTENNITMPISELYNICEFIIQNHTIDSLENLKTQFFSVEQLNKYVMNTAYGITAEGIAPDRDFTGKYQVPSVASLITAIARYLILSAEILYTINGGIPIYTDTDSIPTRAKKKFIKK